MLTSRNKKSLKQPNCTPQGTRKKKEQMKPKVSRKKEGTKIRAELNEIKTEKTIEKINETKNWFLENINKIDKLLARFSNRKRERTQIRNKRGDVTADTTEYKGSEGTTMDNYMPN